MLSRRQFSAIVGTILLPPGMRAMAESPAKPSDKRTSRLAQARPEHWRVATDDVWQWFERQTLVDGNWKVTGITTPVDVATGEPTTQFTGYLADELVPQQLRYGGVVTAAEIENTTCEYADAGEIDSARKARHGRPASPWLRNLPAKELKLWLDNFEPPKADVSGMTFWTHLTQDHGFRPELIEGLTEAQQAKLHGAAHAGY